MANRERGTGNREREARPEGARAITTRRATSHDAQLLTDLARRTFHDAYVATAPQDQLAIHMARSFTPDRQAAELADPGLVTLLAEAQGELAGFAQLRVNNDPPAPACVPGARPVEIFRFYLEQRWTGRGVAQALMAAVGDAARSAGGSMVWLKVYRENHRAIRFYAKCGFKAVGEAPYRFGELEEMDLVMARSAGGPA